MTSQLRITVTRDIRNHSIEPLLDLYRGAFEHLHLKSAIRQWYTDPELRAVMASESVIKLIGHDRNHNPCSLALLSTDLSTIPWVNPAYFRHHFPDYYNRNAIYYITCLLVRPDLHGGPWARAMLHKIAVCVHSNNGFTAFDCCSYNVVDLRLPEMVATVASTVVGVQMNEIDSQHYFVAIPLDEDDVVIDLRDISSQRGGEVSLSLPAPDK